MSAQAPPPPSKGSSPPRPRREAPAQRPTMVQRAKRSAGRAAGKVAYNAASAGASQAASLYRRVVAPIFSWGFQLLRSFTNIQASIAACLAVVALVVALSGLGTLGMLGMIRRFAYVKADIVRPLEFDYSGPVATACISLRDPPPSPALLSRLTALFSFGLRGSELLYPHADHPDPHASPPVPAQPLVQAYSRAQDARAHAYVHDSPVKQVLGQYGQYDRHVVSEQLAKTLVGARAMDRPLSPGQAVSVTVELDLPGDHTDLFQVAVELQSESGKQVTRMARAYMPPRTSLITQAVRLPLVLPWRVLGWSPTHHVKLRVIDRYVEQLAQPAVTARVTLSSRNASMGALPPPAVYKGRLVVKLRLSFARWLLHWMCPSMPLTMLLGTGAVITTLVSGVIAVMLLLVTLLLHRLSGGSGRGAGRMAAAVGGLDPLLVSRLHRLLLTEEEAAGGRGGGRRPGVKALKAGQPNIKLLDYTGEELSTDAGSEYSPHAADTAGEDALSDAPAGPHDLLEEDEEGGAAAGRVRPPHRRRMDEGHADGLSEEDQEQGKAWGSEQGDAELLSSEAANVSPSPDVAAAADARRGATAAAPAGKELKGVAAAAGQLPSAAAGMANTVKKGVANLASSLAAPQHNHHEVAPEGQAEPPEILPGEAPPAAKQQPRAAAPAGSTQAANGIAARAVMAAAKPVAAAKAGPVSGRPAGAAAGAAVGNGGRVAEPVREGVEGSGGSLFAALQQEVRRRPSATAAAQSGQNAR